MPIGLASLGLRAPPVPVHRPPPVNRSVSRAKTIPLKLKLNPTNQKSKKIIKATKIEEINYRNPIAYKNKNWKYYFSTYFVNVADPNKGGQVIVFMNSPKGAPFLIKKSGERKYLTGEQVSGTTRMKLQGNTLLRARKKIHTWQNYLKRVEAYKRYTGGSAQRTTKVRNINQKVNQYFQGNNHALNNFSLSNLIWWARRRNWMTPEAFVRRNGKWVFSSDENIPISRNNFMDHLHAMYPLKRNNNSNRNINY
jgi:hypothetical protein